MNIENNPISVTHILEHVSLDVIRGLKAGIQQSINENYESKLQKKQKKNIYIYKHIFL